MGVYPENSTNGWAGVCPIIRAPTLSCLGSVVPSLFPNGPSNYQPTTGVNSPIFNCQYGYYNPPGSPALTMVPGAVAGGTADNTTSII